MVLRHSYGLLKNNIAIKKCCQRNVTPGSYILYLVNRHYVPSSYYNVKSKSTWWLLTTKGLHFLMSIEGFKGCARKFSATFVAAIDLDGVGEEVGKSSLANRSLDQQPWSEIKLTELLVTDRFNLNQIVFSVLN